MGLFGEKLRNRREQCGLALEAISNTTKISTRMLRALEEENFDQLPGGVFNKGFVRAYARQVGIDEEEAISDYLLALRENQIEAHKLLPDFRASASLPEAPAALPLSQVAPPFSRDIVQDSQISIEDRDLKEEIEARFLNDEPAPRVQKKVRGNKHQPLIAESITQRAAQSEIEPVIQPTSPVFQSSAVPWIRVGLVVLFLAALLVSWNSHRHAGPATLPQMSDKTSAVPIVPGNNKPPKSVAVAVSDKATPDKPSPPAVPPSRVNRQNPVANPTIKKNASHTSVMKLPPTFTVSIRATKTTSVSILADGKPFTQETLIAPAHTSVRASHEVVVKVGNADGVSFLVNGKAISASGNEGEARTYIFGAQGLLAGQAQVPANR